MSSGNKHFNQSINQSIINIYALDKTEHILHLRLNHERVNISVFLPEWKDIITVTVKKNLNSSICVSDSAANSNTKPQ